MKHSLTFSFLIVITDLFCVVSCEKDPDPDEPQELPPITTEGLNTFGCKINGEVWVAEVDFTIGGPVKLQGVFHENEGILTLEGVRRINDKNIFDRIILFL